MRYQSIIFVGLLLADTVAIDKSSVLKRKLNKTQVNDFHQIVDKVEDSERELGLKFSDLSYWDIVANANVGSMTPPPTFPSPTNAPTTSPSNLPSVAPVIGLPTTSSSPTANPSTSPSSTPSKTPTTDSPTASPSKFPSLAPVVGPTTPVPTRTPTLVPSLNPTLSPTPAPTGAPSAIPSLNPTLSPTPAPTDAPSATPTNGPTSFAQAVIEGIALGGITDFDDPESYQSKALARTLEQDGISSMSEAKIIQYYALYCIYIKTYGVANIITDNNPFFNGIQGWRRNFGWEETDVDPCDFHGIFCSSQVVTAIDLGGNFLTGAIPPEIKLLGSGSFSTGAGNLISLSFDRNTNLFNDFDTSWLSDMGESLRALDLSDTSFAGNLPSFPTGLIDIAIFNTLYTGGIESNFGGMTDLNYIDLSQNFFNESLPNLNLLTNLEQIYISDSFLEGGLEFMIGMPNIFECWIDKNPGFDGTIPTEIGSLSTLASFSVTENSLTGTIPSELGNLTDMQRLWMYNNFLTGTIPNELGNMDILKVLRIEGNAFTGTMPDSVCLLRQNPLIELALLGSVCGNNFDQCSCCDCCNFADCNVL